MSPLASLIQRVIDAEAADGNVLNYSDIARRAQELDEDLTRNNVSRYATRRLEQVIPVGKRRALALGLRQHPIVVDRAVALSLGLMLDPLPDDWRTDPDLTRQDRERIAAFIQGIKESKGQARRHA